MARISADNRYIRDSFENVQTNQIIISEDKLRNKLEKQIKRIKKGSGSLSYFSLGVTCVGVIVSAEIKTVCGITPDMWKALFFVIAVFSFYCFFTSIIYTIFCRANVDTIVKDIKTPDKEEHDISLLQQLFSWLKNKFKSNNNNNLEVEEEAE